MAAGRGPMYGDGAIGPGPINRDTIQGMISPLQFVDGQGNLMANPHRFLQSVFRAIQKVGGSPMTTVAELPLDVANHLGQRAFVSDASAPTFGSPVAGGGAVPVPVYCDGASWRVG